MKSVLLYIFAFLFVGVATALLLANLHSPGVGVLGAAMVLYVLALVLAGFAGTVKEALADVIAAVKAWKGGAS